MNMDHIKIEEHDVKEDFSSIEVETAQQLELTDAVLSSTERRLLAYGKYLRARKLMKIAKEYGSLSSHKVRYSPFPHF